MQKLSRREREKQNRRDEILQAAWEVFASKDYDAATIDQVAEAAELSKGTLYLYFQNKADLFLSTVEMGIQKASSMIQEVISSNDDPLVGFKEIIRCMLDFLEENIGFFKILSSERAHFEIHTEIEDDHGFKRRIEDVFHYAINMIADYIQRGIEMGAFRQVDATDVALSLMEIVRGFAFARVMALTEFKLSEKAESIASILLDGIRKRDSMGIAQ